MENFNIVPNPLDEELVQAKRYTLIGMDPIAPKSQVIATLHLRNEEGCGQSLASNDATPLAGIGSPQLTPLIIMLVLINSSLVPPSFL
jgi:hypothetical protein